jgi:hypothetical protein
MMRADFGFGATFVCRERGFTDGSFVVVARLGLAGADARTDVRDVRDVVEEAGAAGEALRLVTTAP